MTSGWRVLVVDDEPEVGTTLSELLDSYVSVSDSRTIATTFVTSFEEAAVMLVSDPFDILVLDIRDESVDAPSDEAGIRVFEKIRSHRFIPIIFYTALPSASLNITNAPFVQTVSKIAVDPMVDLEKAIENIISSGLPQLLQSVSNHLAGVERAFMAEFVEQNWPELVDRPEDMAYLLSRRLAVSFEEGAEKLAQELGEIGEIIVGDTIHPTRYYVQPPNSIYKMGDLLSAPRSAEEDADADTERLYVVLTPSCDLVLRSGCMKAERVVLARCFSLDSFKEYRDWKSGGSASSTDRLRKLLTSRPKGQEDRYFYLPAAWNVPDRVADLQGVTSIPCEELEHYEKIASLDSPFAEALSYQFNRYIGRIGTPDLDIDGVLHRLET